jgi:hypothetical protein
MKFSFNIDTAILITLTTSFLFWCGYWYNYGYSDYFGISISFFEMTIPMTLIDGLIVGIDKFLYFIVFIIFVAFLSGFTSRDASYAINCMTTAIVAAIIFLLYPIFHGKRRVKYKYLSSHPRHPLLIKKKEHTTETSKFRLSKTKPYLFTQNFLYKNKMSFSQIKNTIYGDDNRELGSYIVLRLGIYYFFLIGIVLIILSMFRVGMNLQKTGFQDAENNFKRSFDPQLNIAKTSFNYFPKIDEKESNVKDTFRLTNICNKEACIAVNKEQTTKLVKLEDIQIINQEDKESKLK